MIDAHFHVWNRKDLPWLMGPERPRIFGQYGAIRRDYSIDEYLQDINGLGVDKAVYVQANWEASRYEEEVEWIHSMADQCGWPHGVVGYSDFTQDDVRWQLDALSRYPLVRGLRQQFHWHANPRYRFAQAPGLPRDPHVKKNVSYLADYGWVFDLQVFSDQMSSAAELATECSDVTFVLQHAGMLEDLSDAGRDRWKSGMRLLASLPNVVAKLSGFGTFLHRNDPDFIAEMISSTVAIFGAERCMFGSNFPIEKIWTSYRDLIEAFRDRSAHFDHGTRDAIFESTAKRIYRL